MKPLLAAAALVLTVTHIQAAEPHLAHMVFFTLAEDTAENRETLVGACRKYLSNHDGTVYFSAGVINEDLDRDVNDKNFDVSLHLVFENQEAHDTYQTHPQHLKFIEENKHLWSAVRVFDSNVSASKHDRVSDAGKGFAGMLAGTVTSKQNGQVILNVAQVGEVWRHSKAKKPHKLVGQKITATGREGAEDIGKFIGLLKVGETVTLDVSHKQGNAFTILELTEAQRKRVE